MKVCIIGLGWLGQPLAEKCLTSGAYVSGTTRNTSKAAVLSTKGIDIQLFDLYQHDPCSISSTYFENAVLVLNIPPGRRNFDPIIYQQKMCALIDYAFECSLKQLIFVSTTAVFGRAKGRVTNNTPKTPVTPSAFAHDAIEQHLISQHLHQISILRPSGLVGAARHPAISLSQKSGLRLGKNPVNLIHRDDVIEVIMQIMLQNVNAVAFNLACQQHPSRQTYYQWCAQQLGLPEPGFEADMRKHEEVDGKWIDAKDTLETLGITLRYPDPQSMLVALSASIDDNNVVLEKKAPSK